MTLVGVRLKYKTQIWNPIVFWPHRYRIFQFLVALVKMMFILVCLVIIRTFMSGDCIICPSIDVRNSPKSLQVLENCHMIDGNLTMVLMEKTTDVSDFTPYSFPNLKIITGMFLLFQISYLTTLGNLFPNLTTIGGNFLFYGNYSLVVFDMPHLEQVWKYRWQKEVAL